MSTSVTLIPRTVLSTSFKKWTNSNQVHRFSFQSSRVTLNQQTQRYFNSTTPSTTTDVTTTTPSISSKLADFALHPPMFSEMCYKFFMKLEHKSTEEHKLIQKNLDSLVMLSKPLNYNISKVIDNYMQQQSQEGTSTTNYQRSQDQLLNEIHEQYINYQDLFIDTLFHSFNITKNVERPTMEFFHPLLIYPSFVIQYAYGIALFDSFLLNMVFYSFTSAYIFTSAAMIYKASKYHFWRKSFETSLNHLKQHNEELITNEIKQLKTLLKSSEDNKDMQQLIASKFLNINKIVNSLTHSSQSIVPMLRLKN